MQKIKAKAVTSNWNLIYNFMNENLKPFSINLNEKNKIFISCEEIFVNICKYSHLEKNAIIQVEISYDNDWILILFIDGGIEFDITKFNEANKEVKKDIKNRKAGGLGIYIVKKNSDKLKYERKNNKNYLYFYKKIIKKGEN